MNKNVNLLAKSRPQLGGFNSTNHAESWTVFERISHCDLLVWFFHLLLDFVCLLHSDHLLGFIFHFFILLASQQHFRHLKSLKRESKDVQLSVVCSRREVWETIEESRHLLLHLWSLTWHSKAKSQRQLLAKVNLLTWAWLSLMRCLEVYHL